jgi:hypothetical protein
VKKVYASLNRLLAHHAKNLLEAEGIRCTVLNENVAGAMGEVPFLDCEVEVWVEERFVTHAAAVLDERLGSPPAGKPWYCACGEWLDAQFAQCWQCGKQRV